MEKVYFRLTCMAGSMTSLLAWGTLLRERSDLPLECITSRAQIGEFFASFLTNAYHSWLSLKIKLDKPNILRRTVLPNILLRR